MSTSWSNTNLLHGIHALAGGSGSAVILIPGWPETAEAYAEVFPQLAQRHRVWAVDPPGLGDSAASGLGYDTAAISRILAEAIGRETEDSYHLVGHDIGAWIAYAWASQFPAKLKSLTLLDSAVPGLAPPRGFPLPFDVNVKLWQFSFNALPELPEILTQGRERELLDWLIQHKAEHPDGVTSPKRNRYVECYARPGAMSKGFAYYRAVAKSAAQNVEFGKTMLRMPVLALGGKSGAGDHLRKSMEALAAYVEGGEIDDCGHYVMEEQPDQVAQKLLRFFGTAERTAS